MLHGVDFLHDVTIRLFILPWCDVIVIPTVDISDSPVVSAMSVCLKRACRPKGHPHPSRLHCSLLINYPPSLWPGSWLFSCFVLQYVFILWQAAAPHSTAAMQTTLSTLTFMPLISVKTDVLSNFLFERLVTLSVSLISCPLTLFYQQWDFTGMSGSLWVFLWTLISFGLLCAILRTQVGRGVVMFTVTLSERLNSSSAQSQADGIYRLNFYPQDVLTLTSALSRL